MRLITRSDVDGLVCAMLFKKMGMVDEMKFVHSKDVQDGLVQVTKNDILANLPYAQGCGLWFDHYSSELERVDHNIQFAGDARVAPSAARIVYEYYGGRGKFGDIDEIMAAVDKVESAQFSADEILNPKRWVLLGFLTDARTGLGRFHDYRISNYRLMEKMPDYLGSMTVDEILQLPDVQERIDRYFELDGLHRQMIYNYTITKENVIITVLRNVETIYPSNRFMVFALYPEQNISIWVYDGRDKKNCVIACDHSIINRSSQTNVGALMMKYGGNGHHTSGTCQVPYNQADTIVAELVEAMTKDAQVKI